MVQRIQTPHQFFSKIISVTIHNNKKLPILSNLPPPGKYCLCFKTEGENVWAAQCDKSKALIKVIDTIFEIESFEQNKFILECLIQSERLKEHMDTISFYQ